jgi:hypothetical protein
MRDKAASGSIIPVPVCGIKDAPHMGAIRRGDPMRGSWGFRLGAMFLIGIGLLVGLGDLQAQTAEPGKYCGGFWQNTLNSRQLILLQTCRELYGSQANAVVVRQDAYGWVCRVPGQPDKGINMQQACHRAFGGDSIATLLGIGPGDWRCLVPADVKWHTVPVLLFPAEKIEPNNVAYVTAALRRVEALTQGVRRFYADKTNGYFLGTNAFVLPTATTAKSWKDLSVATADWLQSEYHKQVLKELDAGGWDRLAKKTTFRVGAFVSLGPPRIPLPQSGRVMPTLLSFLSPLTPSSVWAVGRSGPIAPKNLPATFSLPTSVSEAACSPTVANSAEYERAFYLVGNRLGRVLGLPRTDQYPTWPQSLLIRPQDWQKSIMFNGDGTNSRLFPFEASVLYNNWQDLQ